jgi:hypothetical protein
VFGSNDANGDMTICIGQKPVGCDKTPSVREIWRNRLHW